MGRRKKKELPLLEQITIEDVAAEGKAIARVQECVVFVPFVAPGDVVDLQVRRKKHSYMEAEAVHFHHYADVRAVPFCEHFGVCGGCKWQHLPYEAQLKYKQKQVQDALIRIGNLRDLPETLPTLGSERTREYRGKLEFTFSSKRWLTHEEFKEIMAMDEKPCQAAAGFHIPGCFDKVLSIETCHLMETWVNEIRNTVRDYALENDISFEDIRARIGMLRTLMVRGSTTGERMVCVVARVLNEEDMAKLQQLLNFIRERFPELTSLLYIVNNKLNDSFSDLDVHLHSGSDSIWEEMEGLRFKIGAKSFYQTNPEQAYRLYSVVREMAALTGAELVYDLYTGTGTIALFIARQAQKVIGIEYVEDAIRDAITNAEENGIDNTSFFAGDMKDVLTTEFVETHGHPDVLITDPPRAGMHPDVVKVILNAAPLRIVYVSCNPATQARDLQLLEADYKVLRIQPVDMFPHTHHVENVVLLERKHDSSDHHQ